MRILRQTRLRLIVCAFAAALLIDSGLAKAQVSADTLRELTEAARLMSVGDYEGASRLLSPLAPRLAGDPATRPRAVQAYILLATAEVALGQTAEAKKNFVAALGIDPGIRLTEKENSPKVVLVFNEALAQFQSTRKKSHTALIAGGAGVAAAGVYLATKGGSTDATAPTLTSFRFTTPVVTCPDGAESFPITVGLAGELTMPGTLPVTLDSAQITLVITASPGLPSEVGFASSMPSSIAPMTVSLKTTSVTFTTTLVCGNGAGDPPRVNEFLARIALATARGLVTAETADRMRVNIP